MSKNTRADTQTAPNASGNPSSNDRREEPRSDASKPDRMDRSLVRSGPAKVSPSVPLPKE